MMMMRQGSDDPEAAEEEGYWTDPMAMTPSPAHMEFQSSHHSCECCSWPENRFTSPCNHWHASQEEEKGKKRKNHERVTLRRSSRARQRRKRYSPSGDSPTCPQPAVQPAQSSHGAQDEIGSCSCPHYSNSYYKTLRHRLVPLYKEKYVE